MLYQFLLYSKVTQSYIYIYIHTFFWGGAKEKKNSFISLPGKGSLQQDNASKTVLPLRRDWEVVLQCWKWKNRASDKDQGRGKLALFSKLAISGLVVFFQE